MYKKINKWINKIGKNTFKMISNKSRKENVLTFLILKWKAKIHFKLVLLVLNYEYVWKLNKKEKKYF